MYGCCVVSQQNCKNVQKLMEQLQRDGGANQPTHAHAQHWHHCGRQTQNSRMKKKKSIDGVMMITTLFGLMPRTCHEPIGKRRKQITNETRHRLLKLKDKKKQKHNLIFSPDGDQNRRLEIIYVPIDLWSKEKSFIFIMLSVRVQSFIRIL